MNSGNIAQADTLYWLNDPHKEFQKTGKVKQGLKFLAVHDDTSGTVKEEEPSGVLRMDVDHLEAIFDFGLPQQSISRAAALSSEIDLFFTGYVQHLCQIQFARKIAVIYSGGDDLLVVGAWDRTLELAWQIRKDFKAFTCHNPDVSIAGSLVFCRGTYPIHRAADQAEEFLVHWAKENINQEADLEGNVTTCDGLVIFNHRLPWDTYPGLKETGDMLIEAIGKGKMSSAYLDRLRQLHRTWQKHRQINTARLYYMTIRNISDATLRAHILKQLGSHAYLSHPAYIPLLVGYAGLQLRLHDHLEKVSET